VQAVVLRLLTLSLGSRYAIAVALAAASVAARLALEPVWALKLPLITFYPAIMLAAWLGGVGPGIMTTVVCALTANYFWISPTHSFLVGDPGDLIALVLFAAIGTLISALNEAWRRTTLEAAVSRERLRTTLMSIGDAVIGTDAGGRITLMNAVAETLTGWRETAARGRPLREVLVIVNEDSRAEVENPVEKVLREGGATGLANHTLLLSRDGREIPIDDSAAAVRGADGRLDGAVIVFRDITTRRRQEQAVGRLAAVVDASQDAIFTKTLDGTITSWNPGAEQMFGYAAAEIVDQSIAVLVPVERRLEEDALLRQVAAGKRIEPFETERLMKDGQRLLVSVSLSPLRSAGGAIVGISTIARDISEHARLLAAERAARADADRANETKDQFLAVLSHELRQPLNALIGWTRVLRNPDIDRAQQARALEAIERNGLAEARMIDDLLDVARIESGKLTLDRRSVDLRTLLAELVDSLQEEVTQRAVKLDVDVGAEVLIVSGDAARLRQVFMNLLGNALKFTRPGGRIELRLSLDQAVARVLVRDTGVGIAPDLLPHIFERFRQADWRAAGTQGGLGLGLAIVREILELHGGRVEAKSDGLGQGATFVVTLPTENRP
jgi:PAS domain S-box-containing protein